MKPVWEPLWLGAIPFEESLKRQALLKARAGAQNKAFVLGFEPQSAVISQGLRSQGSDILWPEAKLRSNAIRRLKVRRGGEAALHGPGQLLIYPVLPLSLFHLRAKGYIDLLERATAFALSLAGVSAEKREKTAGLFTAQGKIAFFGLHISQGISQNGLALNVSCSLELFSAIKSCGMEGRPHDSLRRQGLSISSKEMFFLWLKAARRLFPPPDREEARRAQGLKLQKA